MTSSESEKVASSSLESEAQLAASFDAPNMLSKKVWHQMVEFEVANARIFNEALSVIFLDVDNLKDTNDTFGQDVYKRQPTSIILININHCRA